MHFGLCSFQQHCEMEGEGEKSFARRDRLLQIEPDARKWWDEEEDIFRAESFEKTPEPGEKFYGNFPNPYMNANTHLLNIVVTVQNLILTFIFRPFFFFKQVMPLNTP